MQVLNLVLVVTNSFLFGYNAYNGEYLGMFINLVCLALLLYSEKILSKE